MPKLLLIWLSRFLAPAVVFVYPGTKAYAQNITLDGSLGTPATLTGSNYTIPQSLGQTVGNNLFHSFSQFNLNTNETAIFQSNPNIQNILSRVTGGNKSIIDGLISTQNKNVNLFLINPNGIIFGQNARLDVGGSFVVSTANSFKFDDQSEFSAINPQQMSLLSIKVPIGLQYGNKQPGEITLQGQPSSELRVTPKSSLIFAGGQIGANQFKLIAPGGRIELAGVAGEGTVDLKVDGNHVSLSLPDNIARADALLNNADLNTTADGGGGIKIDTRNLDLLNSFISSQTNGRGDAGNILLQSTGSMFFRNSGVASVTYGEGNSGNISLKANGSISFDTSSISTSTPSGLGDAGNISLKANGSISFVDHGGIYSDVAYGRGAGGGISLEAGDSILITKEVTFDSEAISERSGAGNISFQAGNSIVISDRSSIYSNSGGKGDAGKISMQAPSLSLLNGSQLVSTTSAEGKGGDIEINATDAVNISGLVTIPVYPDATLLAYSSIRSSANSGATTKAGDIRITTKTLQLSDAAVLNAGTSGSAIGGNITLDTQTLKITGGAKLLTSTFGFDGGNAGNITINASEKIDIVDSDPNFFEQQQPRISYLPIFNDQISPASGLFSNTTPNSDGNGGTIRLSTPVLLLANGAQIVTSTVGSGKAGDIYLGSPDKPIKQITISGKNTGIFASTQASAITLPLKFTTVAEIGETGQLPSTAQTIPTVVGISVEKISGSLDSTNDVDLYRIELQGNQTFSATTLLSQVSDTRLFLFDSNGFGVYANDDIDTNYIFQSSLPEKNSLTPKNPGTYYLAVSQYPVTAVSNGGEIFSFLTPTEISGATGKGGSLPLSGWVGNGVEQNKYTIILNGLTAVPQILPGGDGGNITVNANSLIIKDSAQLAASTSGNGKAGNIQLNVDSLNVSSGGQLLTNTSSKGQAGNITINAASNINLSNPGSGLYANTTPGSTGNGGNIFIDPRTLTIRDGAKIAVDSQGEGISGNIELAAGILSLENGSITAETRSNIGGNITLNLQELLLLRNRSKISTTAGNDQFGGDGGNIDINSRFIVAVPFENSDITANAFDGRGGSVKIRRNQGIFGIEARSKESPTTSDITASSKNGAQGQVLIERPETEPSRGLIELPNNLVDASQQIAQGCTPRRGQTASKFISTGRGGIPENPYEPLRKRAIINNWLTLPNDPNQQTREMKEQIATKQNSEAIVEAQGWVLDSSGEVELVAQVSGDNFHYSSQQAAFSCNAAISP